jgi:predicted SAM-dependent methyltransferase
VPLPKNKILFDIGCGSNKIEPLAYGLDIMKAPTVNILCDIEKQLPIKNEVANDVYSRHTLEHVAQLENIIDEMLRISKPGGLIHIVVPHFSNSLAYSDYTHKRFFGLYTFNYFCSDKCKYWNTPNYQKNFNFKIIRKRLIFRNITLFSKLFEYVFNSSEWYSYIYESKLSWFLPCSEIEFVLSKLE